MIPTEWKSKLPKPMSYPIGAEALSEALADAPNVEAMTLFFGNSQWPASGSRRVLADQTPHDILIAEFWPAAHRGSNENWFLHVYAVPRDLRYMANRLLREQGLPHLFRWLRASLRPDWRARHQKLALRFIPVEESVTADESRGAGLSVQPTGQFKPT
jgi:hypothetical protein